MSKNTVFGILLAVVLIGGVFFIIQQSPKEQPEKTGTVQQKDSAAEPQTTDTVLAGTTTPYVVFTQEAYEKALKEKKVILLNFYATWCPVCRAEEPDVLAAFTELTNESAIGFQVNFNDPETDADEKALAAEFAVPYQHTKVILKAGKEVLKETVQWNKQEFIDAVNNTSK